jgi:hypothetical protein
MKKLFKKISQKVKHDVKEIKKFSKKASNQIENNLNRISFKIQNKFIKINNNDHNNNNNNNNNHVDSDLYNEYNNNNNNNDIAENPYHYDADIQIDDNHDDISNSEKNKIQLKDEDNIPEIYLCPISLQLMTDPVINPYGITYNRDSIEKWLKKSDKDPVTKKKLTKNMLFPNYALKSLIEEYIKENKI